MVQDDDPLISIVTVNYNGIKFLSGLFNSILNLSYPSEKIQIIMVDNGSSDGSVDFVKNEFPMVEIVPLSNNCGYAGGNNEGIRKAKGSYIALVNNDCIVGEDWLSEMLSVFRQYPKSLHIGAVGSKVVLSYPYLPVRFVAASISPEELKKEKDIGRLGVKISDVEILREKENGSIKKGGTNSGNNNNFYGFREINATEMDIKYSDGFYPPASNSKGSIYRWTQDTAVLAVPLENLDEDIIMQFSISSYLSSNNLQIVVGEEILYDLKADGNPQKIKVKIPKSYFSCRKDIINSCGTKINKLFYSRDRGYLSFDEGQYGNIEEVFAVSGSSLLIDRQMLEDAGCFDESFFTYYEDIDLFWRARLKGWKMFFTPDSVVRHLHCGTGKEWSYSFTYHVVRNRMLMIFKCGWPVLFLKCYTLFVLSTIKNVAFYAVNLLIGRRLKRVDIPVRVRVFFELFYMLPKNLAARFKIRKGRKVSDKIIKSWMRNF